MSTLLNCPFCAGGGMRRTDMQQPNRGLAGCAGCKVWTDEAIWQRRVLTGDLQEALEHIRQLRHRTEEILRRMG